MKEDIINILEENYDAVPLLDHYVADEIMKLINKELYTEIESLIIRWNIDGTKTAGTLTRQIMELLKK